VPHCRRGHPSTTPWNISRLCRTGALVKVARVATSRKSQVPRSIDRRAFRRFRFLVPVLFRWADSVEHYDVGKSGNVGLGGMFILAAKCPPLGTEVEIEFTVPAFDRIPRQLRFCCKGQVSRVETCFEVAGFAVAGLIEGGQLGDGIEEAAAGLLTQKVAPLS
jgi:hypothetical protein